MTLLLISFIAGLLTVLAPCVLPLLPIIIGGSVNDAHDRWRPFIITASLAFTVVAFTLILKFSTAFITIPQEVWNFISGTIIIIFGLISIFPTAWEKISIKFNFLGRSNKLLSESNSKKSRLGEVLIGLSLGPVFSSCSPTYFLILATVLPQSFSKGLLYLIVYALGLSVMLLLIALLGQRLIKRLRFAADSHGWFKRGLGALFVLVGIFIISGVDKKIQTYVATNSRFDVTKLEQKLLQSQDMPVIDSTQIINGRVTKVYPRYQEIVNPSGFVNTQPFKIADIVGKKVVLIDFMTYSCINCIRTFPYLNAWYNKYKDMGLEIVAIHTPEFAFEKNIDNVKEAMKRYGIKFPVVLDNDYATWNAYKNNYWPRKYLIDLNGNIVYDHIGEGGYEETEAKIQELLKISKKENMTTVNGVEPINEPSPRLSPETYFGYSRNELLGNGNKGNSGEQNLIIPGNTSINTLYLGGKWNFADQYTENLSAGAKISYRYVGRNVYFVASAKKPVRVKVFVGGEPLTKEMAGEDIIFENGQSYVNISDERLYGLVKSTKGISVNQLELLIESKGLQAYTFTFG